MSIGDFKARENYSLNGLIEFIKKDTPFSKFDDRRKYYTDYNYAIGGRGGWTALAQAVKVGNLEIVREILRHSENDRLIHLETKSGITPLYCTALCEDLPVAYRIARLLIQKGAHINPISSFPDILTSFWIALQRKKNLALVALFIKKGVIIPASDKFDAAGRLLLSQALEIVKKENEKITILIHLLKHNLWLEMVKKIIKTYNELEFL